MADINLGSRSAGLNWHSSKEANEVILIYMLTDDISSNACSTHRVGICLLLDSGNHLARFAQDSCLIWGSNNLPMALKTTKRNGKEEFICDLLSCFALPFTVKVQLLKYIFVSYETTLFFSLTQN